MKKIALFSALLCVGFALPGCPIYEHESAGCYVNSDCAYGFVCDRQTGDCVGTGAPRCSQPSDCDVNETCDRSGRCAIGDCSFASIGCVRGYRCSREDDVWQCVPSSGAGGGGAAGSGEAGSGGAGGESGGGANAGGTSGEGGVATGSGGVNAGGGAAAGAGGG